MAESPRKKRRINYKDSVLQQFIDQKYCDVTFVLINEKDQWETIGAHKFLLTSVSDVFETMFHGKSGKKGSVKGEKKIKIDDINMEPFKLFLSFIYDQDVEFGDAYEVTGFYAAAHKYNVKDALDFAKDSMMKHSNPKDSIIIYETAVLYDIPELKEKCQKVIENRTNHALNSSEFLTVKPETVEFIFQLNDAVISSELDFVWALERYIWFNKENDPEIALKVRPALNCIRFLTLSATDILRTSLLTPEEKELVIESLPPNEDFSKIPANLSLNGNKRNEGWILANSAKQMILSLAKVYKSRYCGRCDRNRLQHNHHLWSCPNFIITRDADLEDIYEVYHHFNLMHYEFDDLKNVYEIYKSNDLVK